VTGPLLAIFPHPDDETFTSAGLMAAAVDRGVSVTVISITRGEEGESSIPGLDTPEHLGMVRETELRDAMAAIGVRDVRFLGFRDSGMEGSSAAAHPLAFVQAQIDTAVALLVPQIRAIRPAMILTFGPEGIYGHPDHLHAHRVVTEAVKRAAFNDPILGLVSSPWQTPALYFATFPREEMIAWFENEALGLPALSDEARANLGVPRAEISHELDVTPWAARKRQAIFAHRTQTAPGGPLSEEPTEVLDRQLEREFYIKVTLP
jgi:N-acetyl-1-D-myo-inositol-2-amino-2-deoxy-alpha-D-glucopyranoside deacetylase